MAYKSAYVTNLPSMSHLMDHVKDLLVDAGWTLQGPSTNPSFHNDPKGFILGWFLHSTGESGTDDINLHLYHNRVATGFYNSGSEFPDCAYLTADIDDVTGTVPVSDGTKFQANSVIRIDDELILVNNVAANNLTGCTRGYGTSEPAAHTADYAGVGNVVLEIYAPTGTYHAAPAAELFMYADYDTAIMSSSETANMTVAGSGPVAFASLAGLGANKLSQHAMVRVVDGAEAGKMRFIRVYTTASGAITYQPFLNAPGISHCDIVSQGFGACNWKFHPGGATMGVFFNNVQYHTSGATAYIWASKDGALIHILQNSVNQFCVFGKPESIYPERTATLTQNAAIGATTLYVSDVTKFKENAKFRIVSQATADWIANRVPGSGWPDLDPIEWVSEELICSSIDPVTSSIGLSFGTRWAYTAGAIAGFAPRWFFRTHSGTFATLSGPVVLGTYLWVRDAIISSHSTHRAGYRAIHVVGDTKTPGTVTADNSNRAVNISYLAHVQMHWGDPEILIEPNTSRWLFKRLAMCKEGNTENIGSSTGNIGIVPFISTYYTIVTAPGGVAHGNIVKKLHKGIYRDFRVIFHNNRYWIVGPNSV